MPPRRPGASLGPSPGFRFSPHPRRTDPACRSDGCVVHVSFTKAAAGLEARWQSLTLTANGHPISHTADALITFNADGSKKVAWTGHWSRTRDDGVDVDLNSMLSISVGPDGHCRTIDGTDVAVTQSRTVDGTYAGFQVCSGVGGVGDYCPSGTVAYLAGGKAVTIVYDGTAQAAVTRPDGQTIERALVCPAAPGR